MLEVVLLLAAFAMMLALPLSVNLRRMGVSLIFALVLFFEQSTELRLLLPWTLFLPVALVLLSVIKARNERKEHGVSRKLPAAPKISLEGLSGRERQVIELLLTKKTQAEIADELGLKTSTVGTYRQRAQDKLGLDSLDELVSEENGEKNGPLPERVPLVLPAMWTAMSLSAVCCWPFGIGACVFIATVAAFGCVWSYDQDAVEKSTPTLKLTLATGGLAVGVILRGIASGVLPIWCGVLGAVASLLVANTLKFDWTEGTSRESLSVLFLPVPMLMLGLCVGPVTPEVVYVQFGPFVLNWPIVLVVAVLASTVASVAVTYLFLDEGHPACLGADSARALHVLQGRGLSELEASVLLAIAHGEKPTEIAERLSIARGTINSYRLRGYRQLGIHSRRELVELLGKDGCVG